MALSDWTLYRVTFSDGKRATTYALTEEQAVEKAGRLLVETYPWLFRNLPVATLVEVVR